MTTFLHLTTSDSRCRQRQVPRPLSCPHIMPRLLLLLALLSTLSLRLFGQTGQKPVAGTSYYIQNVATGNYMSADDDGRLVLSATPMLITVEALTTSESSSAGADVYRLLTPSGRLSATTLEQTVCDGSGLYDMWQLSNIVGDKYNIALRNSGINAYSWLEWNEFFSRPIRVVFTPDASNGEAQWRFLLPADIETMTVILDEAEESYTAPVTNGKTATVKLKRTMTLNSWNTFCVPFSITRQQFHDQFGSDAVVAEYKGLSGSCLQFTSHTGDLAAATPYLVYPTHPADADGYYVFNDINSFADSPATLNPTNDYAYIPTFYKTAAPSGAYLLSKNQLVLLNKVNPIKGFRAYFNDVTGTAAKLSSSWSLDDITTGITTFGDNPEADHKVYNLSGQRMTSSSLPAGIYIVNGKKMVKK